MTRRNDIDVTDGERGIVKVIKHQANVEDDIHGRTGDVTARLDGSIERAEELLRSLGRPLPDVPQDSPTSGRVEPRAWASVLHEAESSVSEPLGLFDLVSPSEFHSVEARLALRRSEFDAAHRLDAVDWAIAGAAGTKAALVDVFLVKLPRSPGFLGGAATEGGPLSNFIRDRLRASCSPEELASLERSFPVPYDVVHSGRLAIPVSGLGPRSHRFQSLGHDPVLGFVIGVADVLSGKMTAIDSTGRLVRQVTGEAPIGMSVFEGIARQFGHLRSDAPTPAGLPAPLMPLLQFLRVGNIGKQGLTIGEVSRAMYAKGYDFGHFLAMSVVPLVVEVLVRIPYACKRIHEGHDLMGSLPMHIPGRSAPPKLQTMLFTAHLIATAANAGRVCLGGGFNPLAVNYPEWVALSKHALGQLSWIVTRKEDERFGHTQRSIDAEWVMVSRELDELWAGAPTPMETALLGA